MPQDFKILMQFCIFVHTNKYPVYSFEFPCLIISFSMVIYTSLRKYVNCRGPCVKLFWQFWACRPYQRNQITMDSILLNFSISTSRFVLLIIFPNSAYKLITPYFLWFLLDYTGLSGDIRVLEENLTLKLLMLRLDKCTKF